MGSLTFLILLVTFMSALTNTVRAHVRGAGKGLAIENYTRLPSEKQQALDKLLTRLRARENLNEELVEDKVYILRFLEAKNFDVDRAELMLLNHLQWREDNNIENIHQEDWSDLEKEYPYRIDGVDKQGRPLLQFDFGKWDLTRQSADLVKKRRLLRYFDKMIEEADMKVLELQSQGRNVSQWLWLVNMDNVNMQKHINVASSPFYWDAASSFESHHPGMANKVILINTPGVWGTMMPIVRSILSDKTNEEFKDYGDEKEWKPIVLDLVDSNQLPPEYGGTKGLIKKNDDSRLLASTFQRSKDGWVWVPTWG